ncbi:hypothetical protein MMC07_009773 [Pseudocyphellaria aurata]|nr:hypothetical protein [Pseudocyphellaria aurata]
MSVEEFWRNRDEVDRGHLSPSRSLGQPRDEIGRVGSSESFEDFWRSRDEIDRSRSSESLEEFVQPRDEIDSGHPSPSRSLANLAMRSVYPSDVIVSWSSIGVAGGAGGKGGSSTVVSWAVSEKVMVFF